jgi:alpha-mannosidase
MLLADPWILGISMKAACRLRLKRLSLALASQNLMRFFLGQYFADVSDDQRGLSVLNRGLPEYQVRRDDATLVLTLFRSVSIIAGRVNSRIGDAGPQMLTPDGQCLRDMNFEYAVFPHIGNVHAGAVALQADDFAHPVLVAETMSHSGSLPSSGVNARYLKVR